MGSWYVYILKCADGLFYTGITNSILQRIGDHNSGKGARYTKSRRPVKLVHKEVVLDKQSALKREIEIKDMSRTRKKELIA